MAVAAYGALQSLAKSLIQTQQHNENGRIKADEEQILSLQNQVKRLLKFLQVLHPPLSSKIETFVQEIKVVAVEAEILIDAQIVYQISGKTDGFLSFTQALSKVIHKLDSWVCSLDTMKAELVPYEAKCSVTSFEGNSQENASVVETMTDVMPLGVDNEEVNSQTDASLVETMTDVMPLGVDNEEVNSQTDASLVETMTDVMPLGVDNEEVKSSERTILLKEFQENVGRVVEELNGREKELRVIWIVGMWGIGKTTMAKHVFNLPIIREIFEVFMWCKISQNYDIVKVLQSILQDESEHDLQKLKRMLYDRLHFRRYLIVLDDIWSMEAWERLRMCFPDYDCKSRIIVTTRMPVVVIYRYGVFIRMPFLDEESSWDLLRENIFHGQQCPSELETIGRQIAKKCLGLPLTLVSVGEELSRSIQSIEIWDKYAETMTDVMPLTVDNEKVKSSERIILLKEFQENVGRVVEELNGREKELRVIWIVGMCGIGKTTLAKHVFNLPIIRKRFGKSMWWCKISQNYDIVKVLQSILQDESEHDLAKLGDMLCERLYSRRYLIVLDDIWSMEASERLRMLFPKNYCNSRIIVTTRMPVVVIYRYDVFIRMPFLDEESSWDLLRENIFHGQQCPSELETIGRQIAKHCAGLPSTLVSVGEELSRSIQSIEIWDKYAENMKMINASLVKTLTDVKRLGVDNEEVKSSERPILLKEFEENVSQVRDVLIEDGLTRLEVIWIVGMCGIGKTTLAKYFFNLPDIQYRFDVLRWCKISQNYDIVKVLQSILQDESEHDLAKLEISSSYNDLPIHLKLCLLYFSRFCESTGMDMENLVTRLMLEGFVKPISDKTMEDVTRKYVEELIGRSVVLVLERDENGEVKRCSLHDLIHDLCLSESNTENFVLIPRTTYYFGNLCCMCGSKSSLERMDISHIVSSKVSTIARRAYMYKRKVNSFVSEVQAAESSVHDFVLPLPILRFWNLEVLHVKVDISTSNELLNLPNEIWEMHQLRELFIKGVVLHKPRKNSMVLEQLETLCADSQMLEDEVVKGIPNVKRLELYYEDGLSLYLLNNVAAFLKLESLILDLPCEVALENIFFPKSLKKLSISCREDITAQQIVAFGSMLNLKILELKARAFVGKISSAGKNYFPELHVLVFHGNWEQFSVGEEFFISCLDKLVLQNVTGFTFFYAFYSLGSIHLNGCDERTIKSAIEILKTVIVNLYDIPLYVNEQRVYISDDDLWSSTNSE